MNRLSVIFSTVLTILLACAAAQAGGSPPAGTPTRQSTLPGLTSNTAPLPTPMPAATPPSPELQRKIEVKTLNSPTPVKLKIGSPTCFIMPGIVQNVRISPDQEKKFVEAHNDRRIFYLTPKEKILTPVNLFVEVNDLAYEFLLQVGTDNDYMHQVIVEADPVEVAIQKATSELQAKSAAEKAEMTRLLDSLAANIKDNPKTKKQQRILFQKGSYYASLAATVGQYYLIQTNVPTAFGGIPDAIILSNFVLLPPGISKLTVMGKEVKL